MSKIIVDLISVYLSKTTDCTFKADFSLAIFSLISYLRLNGING